MAHGAALALNLPFERKYVNTFQNVRVKASNLNI